MAQGTMFCCGVSWVGPIARTAVGAPADAVTSSTTPSCGIVIAATGAASIRDRLT